MKKPYIFYIALSLCFILFCNNNAYAQNTISGKVVDIETLDPVVGATIVVDNDTLNGTTTNNQGYFEITTSANRLYISFIGYNNETISVNDTQ